MALSKTIKGNKYCLCQIVGLLKQAANFKIPICPAKCHVVEKRTKFTLSHGIEGYLIIFKKDSIFKKKGTNILPGTDKEYMLLSIFSRLQFRIKKKRIYHFVCPSISVLVTVSQTNIY